jgi:uncharacterized protein YacL
LGALAAIQIGVHAGLSTNFSASSTWAKWIATVIGGGCAGWLIAFFAGAPVAAAIRRVESAAQSRSAGELVVGGVGLFLGLAVATLAAFAVSALPYVGRWLLVPLYLVLGYVFAVVAARQHRQILRVVGLGGDQVREPAVTSTPASRERRPLRRAESDRPGMVVDTSAIIDGRIADLVSTGFVDRDLVIPVFVLLELQRVADSADGLRRARGRRGLEVVTDLRKGTHPVLTPDVDYADLAEVDLKLVRLAQERDMPILTLDYNLNRVAKIQGVTVLNLNELANALKPAVLPGESLRVKVLREGKEAEQGVGYLDDGTMIVIEGARQYVGDTLDVEVTSVLQSPSGKMIFTKVA